MSDVSAASSLAAGTTASAYTPPRNPSATLDQSDFLELLTVQLANQDPMEPMKDTEFISQMANFTSLEQTQTLTKTLTDFTASFSALQDQMVAQQNFISAGSLLGREVSVAKTVQSTGEDGKTVTEKRSATGRVEEVLFENGRPMLRVEGQSWPFESLVRIGEGLSG